MTGPSARSGALVGAAAGLVVVALMYGLRLWLGIRSLPDVAADALTLVLPGSVFGFLIDRLQEYGRPSLIVGMALGLVALAAMVGAASSAWLRSRRPVVRVFAAAGALSAFTVPVVLVGAAEGEALALATTTCAYWLVLALLLEGGLAPAAARPLLARASSPSRRSLLYGAGATAGVWLAAYLGGRLARAASLGGTRPTAAATPPPSLAPAVASPGASPATPADAFPGLTGITTTPDFYVISKNGLDDPAIDAVRWRLQVGGLRPYGLGYDELRALPAIAGPRTLECISNVVGGNLISTAIFKGAPLKDLLERAGIPPATREIRLNSADGYTESIPLEVALDPSTIVAYLINDDPLPKEHGFPARVLMSGRYGMKNPKWLVGVVPVPQSYGGFWEQRGWNKEAFVRTFSRLDLPQDGAVIPSGNPYPFVRGVAYAGSRGIGRVEISFDAGRSWSDTLLRRLLPKDNWIPFTHVWTPAGPGEYEIRVRAYDGDGVVQDAVERDSFPDGATGLHRVKVKVV